MTGRIVVNKTFLSMNNKPCESHSFGAFRFHYNVMPIANADADKMAIV
jgi:hypothetical protein